MMRASNETYSTPLMPEDENVPPARSEDYGHYPQYRPVLVLILAYCLVQALITYFTSPNISIDSAEQALLGQSLQPVYRFGHGPGISWIHALVDMTIGLSRPVLIAIKYTVMAVGLVAYYFSARIVFRWEEARTGFIHQRNDLSAAAVTAWSLVYVTAWNHNEDQVQSVFLFAALGVTLHAFLKALDSTKVRHWAWFGLSAGIGTLISHKHALLPVALVLAAWTISSLHAIRTEDDGSPLRSRIGLRRVLFATGLGLLALSPDIWFTATSAPDPVAIMAQVAPDYVDSETVAGADVQALLRSRGDGLLQLLKAAVEFMMPLGVIFIVFFSPMWFGLVVPFFPKRKVDENVRDIEWRRLAARSMIIALVLVLPAVAAGMVEWRPRWMLPALFCLPIWLFLQVQRSGPYFMSMRAFAAICTLFILAVGAGRFATWQLDIRSCSTTECRAYLPVDEWADVIRQDGFTTGTIVGAEYHLLGNLKQRFPDARVLDAAFDYNAFPPASETRGSCLVVWRDTPNMPDELAAYLTGPMQVRRLDTNPQGAVRRTLLKSPDKASVLYYRFLRPRETCR